MCCDTPLRTSIPPKMPFSAYAMSTSASMVGARTPPARTRRRASVAGSRVASLVAVGAPNRPTTTQATHLRTRRSQPRRAASLRVEAASGERVAVIGEALWDSLPAGLFLGGAPANVACHLNELGRDATVISRVGDDELGREVLRRLHGRGLATDAIQIDTGGIPTGFVVVTMENAMPSYDIVQPSAWDAMDPTDDLVAACAGAVVVYGSLAQRDARSRAAITAAANAAAKRVFDINLRKPFIDPELCVEHARGCWLLKLNDEELPEMARWLGLDVDGVDDKELAFATFNALDCEMLCVTRGGDGAALLTKKAGWMEHPGFRVDPVDTVGAGDSFLATLLDMLLEGMAPEVALERACRIGAFVATQQGATPRHDAEGIKALKRK